MGDRWSTNGGRLLLDGEHFGAVCNYEAVQLGFTGDHINARAARLMADVLNADRRTNPPKVESFYAVRRTDGEYMSDYSWQPASHPNDWQYAEDDADCSDEPVEYEIVRMVVEPVAKRTFGTDPEPQRVIVDFAEVEPVQQHSPLRTWPTDPRTRTSPHGDPLTDTEADRG